MLTHLKEESSFLLKKQKREHIFCGARGLSKVRIFSDALEVMKVINGAEGWSENLIILDVLDSVSCFENNDFNFTPRPCIVAAHWLAKMG